MMKERVFLVALSLSFCLHLIFAALLGVTPIRLTQIEPQVTHIAFLPLKDQEDVQEEERDMDQWVLSDQISSDVRADKIFWQGALLEDHLLEALEIPGSSQKNTDVKKCAAKVDLSTNRKVLRVYYPSYPSWAQKLGWESDVVLKFEILKNGQVGRIVFEKMSGYPELDALAMRSVRSWTFEPIEGNVSEDRQWGRVKMSFNLD